MPSRTAMSLIEQILSEGRGRRGGTALGGAGLLGLLLGRRRRGFGRNALLLAGASALGKVALDAWSRREAGRPQPTGLAASDRDWDHLEGSEAEERAETLLLAMVAAAKADGHVDEEEESAIEAEMEDLPEAVRRSLGELLRRTPEPEEVAARARGEIERREVYAASALLCGRDDPREVAYLDRLARALGLSPEEARDVEDGLMAL